MDAGSAIRLLSVSRRPLQSSMAPFGGSGMRSHRAIGAPKNTPAEIVAKLNTEVNAALADPDP